MPKIDELTLKSPSKKFEKVRYRPWEIEEQNNAPTQERPIPPSQSAKKKERINDDPNSIVDNVQNSKEADIPLSIHNKELRSLHGVQKSIVQLLSKNIENFDSEFAYTNAFTIQDIANEIRTTKASISASILRLKKKDFIQSNETKPGRGGFASYKLKKSFALYIRSLTSQE